MASLLEQWGKTVDQLLPTPNNGKLMELVENYVVLQISKAKSILRQKGRFTNTNTLIDSINFEPPEVTDTSITVLIYAEDYAQFIDEGVNGNINNFGSPYSFRDKQPPRQSMLDYIKDKMITSLEYYDQKNNKYIVKALDTQEARNAAAYVFARGVKRKGIEPSYFIRDTFNEDTLQELIKAIEEI
jgi:hypothetical protein